MKRIYFFIALFFIMVSCARSKEAQSVETGKFSYAFSAPKAETSTPQPLFILFHPAGSSGKEYIESWLPLLREKGFVFAPSATKGMSYGSAVFEDKFAQELHRIQSEHAISSVILIAESNGAIYGYYFLAGHPDLLDAAIFISGVLDAKALEKLNQSELPTGTKILVVHGTDDKTFAVEMAEDAAYKLKDLGLEVELKKIDGMKHGADPFCQDEILQWLKEKQII